MISPKFGDLSAKVEAAANKGKQVNTKTVFLVFAWAAEFGGCWRMRGKEYTTREAEEYYAAHLPSQWLHRQIVTVQLPGAEDL